MKIVNQEHHAEYKIEDIVRHPMNARRHEQDAIDESVDSIGFYGAIIIHKATGQLLAGHGRLNKAEADGAETIPALVVDVDDDTALQILLADNRTNDLAGYDERALADLLQHTKDQTGSLDGTGWTDADLARQLAELDAGQVQETTSQNPSIDESLERYQTTAFRQIQLMMGEADYEEMIDDFDAIMDANEHLETNYSVVRFLLDKHLGKPERTDDEVPA